MFNSIEKDRRAQIVFGLFLFFLSWWIVLQFVTAPDNINRQIFGAFYGLVALFGAIVGIAISKKWGMTKSYIGKAVLYFSLGLFAQEFGQIVYSVYTFFLKIDIPYPSLGDVGYFGSIPLYILGVIYLAKASGVTVSLRSLYSKFQALFIPALLLFVTYYNFLRKYQFDWSMPLLIFLDFGYPLGQSIYLSLAILTYLLSRSILGGIMKDKILLVIIALFTQYLADCVFLLKASQGTAAPGGLVDLFYLIAYFLMAISLIQFRISKIKENLK